MTFQEAKDIFLMCPDRFRIVCSIGKFAVVNRKSDGEHYYFSDPCFPGQVLWHTEKTGAMNQIRAHIARERVTR